LPTELFPGQSKRPQPCGFLFDGATCGFIVRHRVGAFPSLKLLSLEACIRPMADRLGIAHDVVAFPARFQPDNTDKTANSGRIKPKPPSEALRGRGFHHFRGAEASYLARRPGREAHG